MDYEHTWNCASVENFKDCYVTLIKRSPVYITVLSVQEKMSTQSKSRPIGKQGAFGKQLTC